MDEHRDYFRIVNEGRIQAFFNDKPLQVVDLSASSISVVTGADLPESGEITLKINHFEKKVEYHILKASLDQTAILTFNNPEKVEQLHTVLRKLRK